MSKIAVAMSIYKNDKILHIEQAIESILNQCYLDFDLYIEVDGPVLNDVNEMLIKYNEFNNIFVQYNDMNKGLAFRLNNIIDKAVSAGKYSYLARMDADDISHVSRFTKQVEFLKNNNHVNVVGTDINEISENGEFIFYKKMDSSHELIEKNIIKKCPFNHPSVMFDINIFIDGYRYQSHLMNTQDYYLWVDLLSAGKVFANINEPLLDFRVSSEFHSRRGVKKAINDFKSRLYAFKKLGNFSLSNGTHAVLLLVLRLSPAFIKNLAYKHLR